MDFKQAMCEFGIPTEKIIEYTNQMKLSKIIESIPPRHGKAHFTLSLLYAISSWGDITYGEYLERVENENKTKNC